MDASWLVQHHHGPFALHPRRDQVDNSEGKGLHPLDTSSVDMSFFKTGRRLQMQCKHAGHDQELACSDPSLAKQLVSKGRWQYTKLVDAAKPADFV